MKRPDAARLLDIIEHTNTLKGIIGDHSIDRFINDDLFRSAVLYNLIVIGEASINVTDEMKAKYDQIAWARIKGFRNYCRTRVLCHGLCYYLGGGNERYSRFARSSYRDIQS
jgi:uncharacterized protein with HEPN domain